MGEARMVDVFLFVFLFYMAKPELFPQFTLSFQIKTHDGTYLLTLFNNLFVFFFWMKNKVVTNYLYNTFYFRTVQVVQQALK